MEEISCRGDQRPQVVHSSSTRVKANNVFKNKCGRPNEVHYVQDFLEKVSVVFFMFLVSKIGVRLAGDTCTNDSNPN